MEKSETKDALIIHSLKTLFPLLQEVWKHRPGRYGKIEMAVPYLSKEENIGWERRLQRLYFACGCGEAMAIGLLAIASYWAWLLIEGNYSIINAAVSVLIFLFAGAVGKSLGLQRARSKLRSTVAQLRDVMLTRRGNEGDEWPSSAFTAVVDDIGCGNPQVGRLR